MRQLLSPSNTKRFSKGFCANVHRVSLWLSNFWTVFVIDNTVDWLAWWRTMLSFMSFAEKFLFLNFETSAWWLNVANKRSNVMLFVSTDFNSSICSLRSSLVCCEGSSGVPKPYSLPHCNSKPLAASTHSFNNFFLCFCVKCTNSDMLIINLKSCRVVMSWFKRSQWSFGKNLSNSSYVDVSMQFRNGKVTLCVNIVRRCSSATNNS